MVVYTYFFKKLSESGLNIIAATSLTGAAEQIVAAVKSPMTA